MRTGCAANYPPYDGEGARRAGGRWNSRGNALVYMSENRSLALVEIKVYLSSVIPDRYVLGAAEIPDDLDVGRGRPVGGPLCPFRHIGRT